MRTILRQLFLISTAILLGTTAAFGQDTAAAGGPGTGNWSGPGTNLGSWTNGAPVAGGSAYIGVNGTYAVGSLSGALNSATITLINTSSPFTYSSLNVYLGYGSGATGVLNLESNPLNLGSGTLYIGVNGGTGTLNESTGGYLKAGGLVVDGGNTFAFTASDSVGSLTLNNGSTAILKAAGNVTGSITADDGSASTLDMGNQTVSATTINLGYNNGGALAFSNRGAITATNLYVGNQTFNFGTADSVSNYYLKNATSTTAAEPNITGNVTLSGGSTLNLGANMSLSGNLSADNSTITAGAYSLTAGGNITLGSIATAASLSTTGNVTANSMSVLNGSTLGVGGTLSVLNGNLSIQGSNSSVNVNNLSLSNNGNIYVGWSGSGAASLTNTGTVTATNNLYLGNASTLTVDGSMTLNSALTAGGGSFDQYEWKH